MLDGINIALVSLLAYLILVPVDHTPSWYTVKKEIKAETLREHRPVTLYGGCAINKERWVVDLTTCNYSFNGNAPKEGKINMEHIVPSARMAAYLNCGTLNRDDCRKSNKKFKACHNNKRNIYPAVAMINSYRGKLPFTEIKPSNSLYPFGETVDFKKSKNGKFAEPPERSKIAVATAYFAMANEQCIELSDKEVIVYNSWLLPK